MHVCVGGSLFFHGCSSEQIVLYNHILTITLINLLYLFTECVF